ncbi:MAG: hypothetical protein ABIT82_04435, partial [Ramlibacter sp.]
MKMPRFPASLPILLPALLLTAAALVSCGGGEPSATDNNLLSTIVPPSSYWSGVTRAVATSPLGNRMALSCHNCYGDTTAETNTEVAKALGRGFDLIELDLTLHSNGTVYVEHDDSAAAHGTLAAALANASLQASDRMLFLEIKEAYTTQALSDTLMLGVLRAVRDANYASAGRPVFLRAFMDGRHNHLVRARALLAGSEFAGIRSYVKFHGFAQGDARNKIRTAKSLGFHAVELEYRMADLFGAIMQAKLLGLGVGVYTGPASMGELYISALREDIDFLTTEYDRGATAAASSARSLVQEATSLAYLNTGQQTGYPLHTNRTNSTDVAIASGAGTPALEILGVATDEDRVGGSMVFAGAQSITTYDADNAAAGGFLVSAVVNFDDLTG